MAKNYIPILHINLVRMDRYYDIILGLIPLALFGITGVLVASGYGVTTAAPVGATVSMALMGHALFVRAPVEGTPTEATVRQGRSREATESTSTREDVQSETASTPATPFETAD